MKTAFSRHLAASTVFLEKSLACHEPADAERFQALSQREIEISLELYRTLSCDSLAFSFSIYPEQSYSAYVDFCARNDLLCMEQVDFDAAKLNLKIP